MQNEELEFQQKLLDNLNEWKNGPDFGSSKYDQQKYNRAKGMLQATHPDVLAKILGTSSLPNSGKETLNLIRTTDLRTLKNLEIFRGLDDKVVGHHMSAFGAIEGALSNQSPERRLELLNRSIEAGYTTGMDESGIGPIRTSIHKPIAHEGDFSGKKPGYKVQTFTNADDIEDVWSGLESSLKQQKGSFMQARAHQSTQDLVSASKGAFGGDLITDLSVPMDVRTQASKAADSIATQVDQIITKYSGNDQLIQDAVKPIAIDLPKLRFLNGTAMFNQGLGGLAGFLTNKKAVNAAMNGDAKTAVTEGAKDFVIGEAISQGVQRTVIPAVQKIAPSFVRGAAKFLGPAGLIATALQSAASAPDYGGMTELTKQQ